MIDNKGRNALRLLSTVWKGQRCESWDGVNHSMADALRLAIGANLRFHPKDFEIMNGTMRSGYWIGENGYEWFYALAISVGNKSFIEAFEYCYQRKPFFANKVRPVGSQGYTHLTSTRARERLGIGSEIEGYGEVTSITNERVVVVSRPLPGKSGTRRYKWTHDQLKELFPAPKKPKKVKTEEVVE